MQQTPSGSLTTSAAAKLIGVHPDTLVRWADAGKVRHWRTPGGQRRFAEADVLALLETPSDAA